MNPDAGYFLKLRRAKRLYAEMAASFETYVREQLAFESRLEPQGHEDWEAFYWTDVPEPDPMYGVILGEIAHDTRSALDHLLHDLVVANGRDPGDYTQFPAYDTESRWIAAIEERDPEDPKPSPIAGVSAEVFTEIKAIQPFHSDSRKSASRHPLSRLMFINNADKHRILHSASVAPREMNSPSYVPFGYVRILETRSAPEGTPLRSGEEIGRVRRQVLSLPSPASRLRIRLRGKAELLFSAPEGKPIVSGQGLGDMLNYITQQIVVPLVERFLD